MRPKFNRSLPIAAVSSVCILTALVSGCGGEDNGTDASAATAPVPPVTAGPSPAASPTPAPTSTASAGPVEPLFPNSIVSNDLAFIELGDRSVEYCVESAGIGTREVPGSPSGRLVENGVYIFVAQFSDGTSAEIWGNPSFGSAEPVEEEADEIAKRLALLPTFMRETLSHVVLHTGDETAFAEDIANFFVVYADNMAFRRSENDMEETLFHESVHATMDVEFRDNDPRWREAQESDPGFITVFARDRVTEDLAESAIFAFTEKYHPGRLPQNVAEDVARIMPARLEYIQSIFPSAQDYFEDLRPAAGCLVS